MTLRIIAKRAFCIAGPNHVDMSHRTFDIDAPELEEFLRGGGFNPDSFDVREVIGAEVIPAPVSGSTEAGNG